MLALATQGKTRYSDLKSHGNSRGRGTGLNADVFGKKVTKGN